MEKGRIINSRDVLGGMKSATIVYPSGTTSVACMTSAELDWRMWCQRMTEEGKLSENDLAQLKGILIELYGRFI